MGLAKVGACKFILFTESSGMVEIKYTWLIFGHTLFFITLLQCSMQWQSVTSVVGPGCLSRSLTQPNPSGPAWTKLLLAIWNEGLNLSCLFSGVTSVRWRLRFSFQNMTSTENLFTNLKMRTEVHTAI